MTDTRQSWHLSQTFQSFSFSERANGDTLRPPLFSCRIFLSWFGGCSENPSLETLRAKMFNIKEKPFTCSESRYPSYLVSLWGEKSVLFIPPFRYLWSSACALCTVCTVQVILSVFWYRWAAVYPNCFYPVITLLIKRTAVTRAAYYKVTWLPVYTFYLHVHHAFLLIWPKVIEYSILL